MHRTPLGSGRTKYIDVPYHHIRDFVKKKNVKIEHVPSERKHANIVTRLLSAGDIWRHRDLLLNSRRESSGPHYY